MKKRRGSSNFTLIDDRTVVLGFLAFLVIVLLLFDAAADQQALYGYKSALSTRLQSSGGVWGSTAATQALTKELADQVVSKLTVDSREKDGVAFIVKDTVDPQLLEYFTEMDYETIKARLGIQSDFVIHFEDEAGMVIPIGNSFCIGSKDAKINGVPCS